MQRVGLGRLNSSFCDYCCFVFVFALLELHPDLAAQSFVTIIRIYDICFFSWSRSFEPSLMIAYLDNKAHPVKMKYHYKVMRLIMM